MPAKEGDSTLSILGIKAGKNAFPLPKGHNKFMSLKRDAMHCPVIQCKGLLNMISVQIETCCFPVH